MDAVSEVTKAWLAGFFDGEGCVVISMQRERRGKSSDSLHLNLNITNTDLGVLESIQEIYLGRIRKFKKYANRRQCYSWTVTGNDSAVFAQAILPYSRTKRQQLELYLHARTLFAKPHELQSPFSAERKIERAQVAQHAAYLKHLTLVQKEA